jgi:hypothetical protein
VTLDGAIQLRLPVDMYALCLFVLKATPGISTLENRRARDNSSRTLAIGRSSANSAPGPRDQHVSIFSSPADGGAELASGRLRRNEVQDVSGPVARPSEHAQRLDPVGVHGALQRERNLH